MSKNKNFDCLNYKYEEQERIYNDIKDLSIDEEIAYFNRKVKEGPFNKFVESLVKSDNKVQTSV